MTETRYKETLDARRNRARAGKITSILGSIRVRKRNEVENLLEKRKLSSRIRTSLGKRDSIAFVLPAFPFKSQNTERKCIGELPDKAEEIAAQNITDLGVKLSSVAQTNVVIALDGFTYADIVGIPTKKVIQYASGVRSMFSGSKSIQLFDFHETEESGQGVARMLDEKYAPPLEEVEREIRENPLVKARYVGLKRFWEHDLDNSENGFGCKERQRRAKEIALRMLARNAGYSKYLAEKFPDAIRLSIHPSHEGAERYHVNLLPETGDTSGGSPWHGAALRTRDGKWKIIRREQAEREGYPLVYENDRPSYFVERKS